MQDRENATVTAVPIDGVTETPAVIPDRYAVREATESEGGGFQIVLAGNPAASWLEWGYGREEIEEKAAAINLDWRESQRAEEKLRVATIALQEAMRAYDLAEGDAMKRRYLIKRRESILNAPPGDQRR